MLAGKLSAKKQKQKTKKKLLGKLKFNNANTTNKLIMVTNSSYISCFSNYTKYYITSAGTIGSPENGAARL